ncbi:hypothetical protein DACRYDRAFT_69644 [Dacryopinax primogenitus]|uniref:COP9 signalosome complex subunit 3 n=1 Tax=Dacryopinax primogenitus (strain DJM 731) TaxID=1858805 RepID=M5G654_DACPD|nr:uncharacterized protein DACRYDRAFT_69644 [Dacryopinax primogenitus]EJT99237.1 hypothetical protein DACRYDRAFT_69644 [Dacryopinax primogenitus]
MLVKHQGALAESLLGGLANGQDPLVNVGFGVGGGKTAAAFSLGTLFILSARLSIQNPPPTSFQTIVEWCGTFEPHQARLAPERMTKLVKGIVRWAEQQGQPEDALEPLRLLVTRYPPSPAYLTNIHPVFVQLCCTTRHFSLALPILSNPITEIDASISDLHYTDNLIYHYCGGVAYGALKRWKEAADFFEIAVSSPATVASAIQIEAYKKYSLIQLILYGKTSPPPKYTSPPVSRAYRNSSTTQPYLKFINAVEISDPTVAHSLAKETDAFVQDNNLGLVNQVLARLPWLAVKKLKETYMKLSLEEIGRSIASTISEDGSSARALIVEMVAAGELSAIIHPEDETVSFEEESALLPQPGKQQVERALESAREAVERLAELDRTIGRSRDYIQKALHQRDSGGMGWQDEEAMMPQMRESWENNL